MSWQEFVAYVEENFNVAPEAIRLIRNILEYIAYQGLDEEESYNMACALLDGTIGLSDQEIKQIIF